MISYLTTGTAFLTTSGEEGAKAEAAVAPTTTAARVRRGAIFFIFIQYRGVVKGSCQPLAMKQREKLIRVRMHT